jgi:hypothetical protein
VQAETGVIAGINQQCEQTLHRFDANALVIVTEGVRVNVCGLQQGGIIDSTGLGGLQVLFNCGNRGKTVVTKTGSNTCHLLILTEMVISMSLIDSELDGMGFMISHVICNLKCA